MPHNRCHLQGLYPANMTANHKYVQTVTSLRHLLIGESDDLIPRSIHIYMLSIFCLCSSLCSQTCAVLPVLVCLADHLCTEGTYEGPILC